MDGAGGGARVGPVARHLGARDIVPLRAGARHAHGHHGGHRPGRRERHTRSSPPRRWRHLHDVDTVVLDKTGTVTQGKPEVTDVLACAGRARGGACSAMAACRGAPSRAPAGHAPSWTRPRRRNGCPSLASRSFTPLSGEGLSARRWADATCLARQPAHDGERRRGCRRRRRTGERLADEGKTPLFFADDGRLLGVIAVADTVKPTSRAAVAALPKAWAWTWSCSPATTSAPPTPSANELGVSPGHRRGAARRTRSAR